VIQKRGAGLLSLALFLEPVEFDGLVDAGFGIHLEGHQENFVEGLDDDDGVGVVVVQPVVDVPDEFFQHRAVGHFLRRRHARHDELLGAFGDGTRRPAVEVHDAEVRAVGLVGAEGVVDDILHLRYFRFVRLQVLFGDVSEPRHFATGFGLQQLGVRTECLTGNHTGAPNGLAGVQLFKAQAEGLDDLAAKLQAQLANRHLFSAAGRRDQKADEDCECPVHEIFPGNNEVVRWTNTSTPELQSMHVIGG